MRLPLRYTSCFAPSKIPLHLHLLSQIHLSPLFHASNQRFFTLPRSSSSDFGYVHVKGFFSLTSPHLLILGCNVLSIWVSWILLSKLQIGTSMNTREELNHNGLCAWHNARRHQCNLLTWECVEECCSSPHPCGPSIHEDPYVRTPRINLSSSYRRTWFRRHHGFGRSEIQMGADGSWLWCATNTTVYDAVKSITSGK